MALEKVIEYRGEFLADGHIQVCQVTKIMEDGKVISSNNHRHVIAPGDDYSKDADVVKAVCSAVQTQKVIDAYQAAKAAKIGIINEAPSFP